MKTILPETFQKVKVMGGTRLIGVSDQSYQPTLSQLRAFVAVAKYRHFGTAATRLNVSQPTLSQALAALENGLGVHLIERSTRRVLVTPAGARLLPQAQVMVGGPAMRVPMKALEAAKRRSDFVANIFCRYSDYLLAQVQQSVACNTFHSIQQRAARWLLTAQDRAGDRIELTQEALAGLLGVQRTTVNAVAGALQEEGLITVRRGRVLVLDRDGLRRASCECYDAVERHFEAIIGESGSGAAN